MALLVLVVELALGFALVHAVLDALVALDALGARQHALVDAVLHVPLAGLDVLEPVLDAVVRVLVDAQANVLDALAVVLVVRAGVNLHVLDVPLHAAADAKVDVQAIALAVQHVLAIVLLRAVVVAILDAKKAAKELVIVVQEPVLLDVKTIADMNVRGLVGDVLEHA